MNDAASKSREIAAHALEGHRRWRGKVQIAPKCPIRGHEDFALWYTPGVAAVARAIANDTELSYEMTGRGDTVAIISDGSRVLGLGDVGATAALPVMEGKALLFKYLGAVDAVPLCISRSGAEEIVDFTQAIAPGFGGVNLEDIATPKCFRVLQAVRDSLPIPVWHDDQQGSAVAAIAGLTAALEVVDKPLRDVRIALVGAGAANVSVYRLLKAAGAHPARIRACDSRGVLHRDRADIKAERDLLREKWMICLETNPECVSGGVVEALAGADACFAFSAPGPDVIPPEAIAGMAKDAIVFACANPTPEIWPDAALAAGARIVGTGRSDFANQVNNALVFPGLFRGVLDVRAAHITDGMALAAAGALVQRARALSLDETRVLPRLDDIGSAAAVAEATAVAAMREGVARLAALPGSVRDRTSERVAAVRRIAAQFSGAEPAATLAPRLDQID